MCVMRGGGRCGCHPFFYAGYLQERMLSNAILKGAASKWLILIQPRFMSYGFRLVLFVLFVS